jgi:hypothetical protein
MYRIAAVIPVATILLSGTAFAQSAPPIDLFVTAFFGVETTDQCVARVRTGFSRAGYSNIADEPTASGVKGVMRNGDTAGVSSMVSCIAGGGISIAIASAGASSLGDSGPLTQNNRLRAAIQD